MNLLFGSVIQFLVFIANHNTAHGDHIVILTFPIYSVIKPLIPTIDELYYKYGHTTSVVMTTKLAESAIVKNSTIDIIVSKSMDAFKMFSKLPAKIDRAMKGEMPYGLGYVRTIEKFCKLLSDDDLYRDLESRPIKLAIVSSAASATCWTTIPYRLSIPFILYGQNYDPINERIPYSASFIPANPVVSFPDKMNLIERTINFILFSFYTFSRDVILPCGVVEKFAPGKSYISASDLRRKSELYLFEYDVLIDYPRPMFPNCVSIGGIGTVPAMPLEKKFQLFMDSANEGAIVVSFGSIIDGLPNHVISKFIKTFQRLIPIKIVFKHKNVTSHIGENILISPWIPQNDLLGHKNTRLFITHCGNGGQYEALYHGVPMIGFPMLWEQYTNARRMEEKGFGIAMEISDFTQNDLIYNINKILTTKKYKSAIRQASQIFRGRQDTPNQRMAYWTNHVIKYGGEYMRPSSLDLPFYQYHMLDVLLVLTSITALLYLCIKTITVRLVQRFNLPKQKTD